MSITPLLMRISTDRMVAKGVCPLMLFWTARWVASDAIFLARFMIMSARGRARSRRA
ncbi:MAG: hypothetical protein HYX38_17360 [Rhodospirillales bacterium]|nr:hypothetical protein [Rhodospirillales bacterium]